MTNRYLALVGENITFPVIYFPFTLFPAPRRPLFTVAFFHHNFFLHNTSLKVLIMQMMLYCMFRHRIYIFLIEFGSNITQKNFYDWLSQCVLVSCNSMHLHMIGLPLLFLFSTDLVAEYFAQTSITIDFGIFNAFPIFLRENPFPNISITFFTHLTILFIFWKYKQQTSRWQNKIMWS